MGSITTGHPAAVLGVGAYRPRRVVSNEEVCEHLEVDADWVLARSGIATRRFADADETMVAMADAAARDALTAAGVAAGEIGVTLVATMSSDAASPQVATRVAASVGAVRGAAMDLGAACAGFCYALEVAASLVRAGHGAVLVVGVERMSDIIDPTDRSTAFLFGDGAGAVVVGPSAEPGIGPAAWGADGAQSDLIVQAPTWLEALSTGERPALRMQGPAVFRWATSRMVPLVYEALEKADCKPEQLDAFVPHQANARITDGLVKALALPEHVAVARDVAVTGNTSAASVPLAMHELLTSGRARPGDLALLCGFGAGLTFASQVVTLPRF
ncbi:beta-ketoacyl-ACP synthase 3 [Actinomycetospora termitidis]|uniref:Beta-ketoacyl-ACP synthase 3 n=1 Tax=Actinomycetospora termitidis TaxID=3053470 RepID=A0ABT7MEU2_9PSEU|nr:beta-ketoacyl-ACP synthase 3 [Actinomycetospora sp. Odt1-22]MDL5159186.1 beta-ketoacyl-ACP synthase 3 [Actinomycetospora sp. Odt1-22]